jgi:predicted acylesterase/phospholipase RssA
VEGVDMKEDVLVSSLAKKVVASSKKKSASEEEEGLRWRLEHLETQMQKLSELVRDHAEDVDRLVRIVAEDRNAIRQQLLRKHQQQIRVRKHLRASNSKPGVDL